MGKKRTERRGGRRGEGGRGEKRSNNQPEVMNKQDLCCKPSPLNLTSTSILPSMSTGESISRTIISVDLKFLNPIHSLEGSKALQWYLRRPSHKLEEPSPVCLIKGTQGSPEPLNLHRKNRVSRYDKRAQCIKPVHLGIKTTSKQIHIKVSFIPRSLPGLGTRLYQGWWVKRITKPLYPQCPHMYPTP